jgi:hypothetical protein
MYASLTFTVTLSDFPQSDGFWPNGNNPIRDKPILDLDPSGSDIFHPTALSSSNDPIPVGDPVFWPEWLKEPPSLHPYPVSQDVVCDRPPSSPKQVPVKTTVGSPAMRSAAKKRAKRVGKHRCPVCPHSLTTSAGLRSMYGLHVFELTFQLSHSLDRSP